MLANYFLEGTPQVMAGTRKRVLIVDDDPGMASVLEYRLGKAGYEVITAEDGA